MAQIMIILKMIKFQNQFQQMTQKTKQLIDKMNLMVYISCCNWLKTQTIKSSKNILKKSQSSYQLLKFRK